MNVTATTAVETPVATAPVKVKRAPAKTKPAAKKKAPAKAAPKASANGKAKAKASRGMADVPAAQRRVALVKLLRKVGATGAGSAKPVSELAAKLGYTKYDVYCLAYHKYHLATAGILKTTTEEGVRGLVVYLTAKGVKATDEQVAG